MCLQISNFAVVRHWLSFPFRRPHTANAVCGCKRCGWDGRYIFRYPALWGKKKKKSPFFRLRRAYLFFLYFFPFFCTFGGLRLGARPLTLITPHLCIHLHRILSSEERCAWISQHFSPFHVYIPGSTARAELVRKEKKHTNKQTKKKRPHVECLFQCEPASLHFRFAYVL